MLVFSLITAKASGKVFLFILFGIHDMNGKYAHVHEFTLHDGVGESTRVSNILMLSTSVLVVSKTMKRKDALKIFIFF